MPTVESSDAVERSAQSGCNFHKSMICVMPSGYSSQLEIMR